MAAVLNSERRGFAFGEVVEIMIELYGLDPARRETFIGRLQQLQRLGIPRQTNVGRGVKARYLNWQVGELMISLDLLDCGITPATLATYFGSAQPSGGIPKVFDVGGMGYHIQQSSEKPGNDLFYIFQPHSLGYLKRGGSAKSLEPLDLEQSTVSAAKMVAITSDSAAVVINVTARLRALREAVRNVVPDRIDQLDFFPTRSGGPEGD